MRLVILLENFPEKEWHIVIADGEKKLQQMLKCPFNIALEGTHDTLQ